MFMLDPLTFNCLLFLCGQINRPHWSSRNTQRSRLERVWTPSSCVRRTESLVRWKKKKYVAVLQLCIWMLFAVLGSPSAQQPNSKGRITAVFLKDLSQNKRGKKGIKNKEHLNRCSLFFLVELSCVSEGDGNEAVSKSGSSHQLRHWTLCREKHRPFALS